MSKEKKFSFPHPIVTMFLIIVVLALCSYVIPAGSYDRVLNEATGRNVVDPETYHKVEPTPVGFLDVFKTIPKGMAAGQEVIFFILLVGGAFQIITATGAIEAGIGYMAMRMKNKGYLMIPLIICLFSIGGTTFGMAEENIVFVPIGIALARALGYDAMVGMTMVTLGAACGFCSGALNPFTVGIAQQMAELPMFSGIYLRIIVWIVMIVITALYISYYAKKVKADPSVSHVRELELAEQDEVIQLQDIAPMNGRQKLVLLVIVLMFAALIYGIFKLGWGITDIGAMFIVGGIVSGLIGNMGPNQIVKEFISGVRSMAGGAVMVGVARAILVVMQDGMIIDTVIYYLSSIINVLPRTISVIGMYIVQVIVNFFVPSGTGQAAATMPIMVPLSDILGINRQVTVLAFQFGDGFTSSIIPTSGTLMALLAVAKIPYGKYVKFVAPLMGIWLLMGGIFVVVANVIHYGPF